MVGQGQGKCPDALFNAIVWNDIVVTHCRVAKNIIYSVRCKECFALYSRKLNWIITFKLGISGVVEDSILANARV